MRKIIWIGGLLLIIVVCSSYRTHYRYGVYIDDVKKIKQEEEKWCYYAVAQMAGVGGRQCDCAEGYRQWKASQGEFVDSTYTCCKRRYRCQGVDIDDAINFWNYLKKGRKRYWCDITFYYNEEKGSNYSLPRFGVIDYHSVGGEYHAIWVFSVKIDVVQQSSLSKRITYEVSYIDPETGRLDYQRVVGTSGSCLGLSTIAIME